MAGERYLRREIGRTLNVHISDPTWAWFIDQDIVHEMFNSPQRIPELIAQVRTALHAFGHFEVRTFEVVQDVPPKRKANATFSRQAVLSRLAAQAADDDEEVKRFRASWLPQSDLTAVNVESWILERFREEASKTGPTWWLVGVPISGWEAARLLAAEDSAPIELADVLSHETVTAADVLENAQWQLLAYGVPLSEAGHMEERKLPIVVDSTLDHLRQLSTRLAGQYGWTGAQATTFVLTGLPPMRLPITTWTEHNARFPGLSVIHLAVDPGVSPKEVGNAYLEERQQLLGTRYRDLSEKHLALAQFAARQPSQLSWAQRMADWNELYGLRGWDYTEVANFSHDCLQALRRLLRAKEPIPSPSEARTEKTPPEENPAAKRTVQKVADLLEQLKSAEAGQDAAQKQSEEARHDAARS